MIELDASQVAVAQVDARTRQVVIAGPGAGKTEVLSSLYEHLLDDDEVDARRGVLVISFSNAAVHAADRRLRARGLPPPAAQTLDSLAAELLRDETDAEIERMSFDHRIIEATRVLRADGWSRVEELDHLIVDEVQDVVGCRADFLIALLESLPDSCGFTLLGDLAQGIYDFQIATDTGRRSPRSTTTSQELLHRAARMPRARSRELTGQYRAASRDSRAAIALRGAALRLDGLEAVDTFLAGLVDAGDVEGLLARTDGWDGTTVFLTNTNGQALLVADLIAGSGRRVGLQRGARDRALARWIAELLADWPASEINRVEFRRVATERAPGRDEAAMWRALRSVADGRNPAIDIPGLARRLRGRRLLVPELLEGTEGRIVVSTIHKAKGLEFDNVVLVSFPGDEWVKRETPPDQLARAKFVALTRARSLLVRANGLDDQWVHADRASGRAYRVGFKKRAKTGIELVVTDFDVTSPGGNDPAIAQEVLRRAAPDTPVALVLDPRRSTLDSPVYRVIVDDVVVGRTSESFGEALGRFRFPPRNGYVPPWPSLSGARMASAMTVAGDPQNSDTGRHGLWLAPVLTGLTRIDWKGSRND